MVVPLYCKQWVIDGVSDKIAKPSLSWVVLLLELGWAVSCHIMSKRTVPWAQVDQQQHHHHQELVRNRNSRALPRMNSNLWEWGPALSVVTSPALRSQPHSSQGHSLPSVSVTLFWEREQSLSQCFILFHQNSCYDGISKSGLSSAVPKMECSPQESREGKKVRVPNREEWPVWLSCFVCILSQGTKIYRE